MRYKFRVWFGETRLLRNHDPKGIGPYVWRWSIKDGSEVWVWSTRRCVDIGGQSWNRRTPEWAPRVSVRLLVQEGFLRSQWPLTPRRPHTEPVTSKTFEFTKILRRFQTLEDKHRNTQMDSMTELNWCDINIVDKRQVRRTEDTPDNKGEE